MAAIAVVIAGLLGGVASPRRVEACSRDADVDPIEGLDVIVTGYATDVGIVGTRDQAYFLLVDVGFEVDRYVLGDGPTAILLRDTSSATPLGLFRDRSEFEALDLGAISIDELSWDGSGGACGALDADPRGQYWIVGASRMEDGTLRIHRFSMFAIGTGPDDPHIQDRLTFVEGLLADGGVAPANSGNAGISATPSRWAASIALLIVVLVAVMGLRTQVRPHA